MYIRVKDHIHRLILTKDKKERYVNKTKHLLTCT